MVRMERRGVVLLLSGDVCTLSSLTSIREGGMFGCYVLR